MTSLENPVVGTEIPSSDHGTYLELRTQIFFLSVSKILTDTLNFLLFFTLSLKERHAFRERVNGNGGGKGGGVKRGVPQPLSLVAEMAVGNTSSVP